MSRLPIPKQRSNGLSTHPAIQKLIDDISVENILTLLELEDFSPVFDYADRINHFHHGKYIDIRAIVEFSNYCRRKCKYCGLNATNSSAKRYRMTEEEVIQTAIHARKAGYLTAVLQSGEDAYFTIEKLGFIVKEIKKQVDMFITLSCGEKSFEELAYLKDCGADRYLLKHETADTSLYGNLHPCGTLAARTQCLRDIKKLGYDAGSGFMIGLPTQTLHTIAEDLFLLYDLQCDMAGIGPFIPHPETELRNCSAGNTELTKKAVAIARILLPKANLPATTSLGVLYSEQKNNVFSCGANVIMRKVTPPEYVQLYDIYPTAIKVNNIKEERQELETTIRSLGKIPR